MRIRLGLLCLLLTATAASAQSLEQQAICAKQAKIAFEDYNADYTNYKIPKPATIDYHSHYNTKLNKCLIDIEGTEPIGQELITSAILMDAFKRRVYASYQWSTKPNKKYWEVPPIICELTPTSHEKTNCSSKDEYDAFVAKYMEE
jgi:hypothetical protein